MIFDCCVVYGAYWQETAALTAFFIYDQRVSGGKFLVLSASDIFGSVDGR